MKKIFLLLAMAVFTTMSMVAQTYYVAGDATLCGDDWNAAGNPMSGTPASITFNDVPKGSYNFKVTDGTWTNSWGWSNIAPASIVTGVEDNGGNIKFTIGGTANITITFNGSQITLQSSIGFVGAIIDKYTVVGDAGLCGTGLAWNTTSPTGDMTQEGSVYVKTFTDVAAGTLNYKVIGNNSYSVFQYPSSNKTVNVATAGSTVKITFDPAVPSLTEVVTPPQTETTYYVAGDAALCGDNWNSASNPMSGAPATKVFSNVPAGTYNFKVTNGAWEPAGQSWGWSSLAASSQVAGVEDNNGNIRFTISATSDITITFDGTEITLASSNGFGELVINTYSVVGDLGLTGADWDLTSGDMDQNGDVWVKTFTNVMTGSYEFKIVGDHSFGIFEYPAGENNNETATVTIDYSTVKITFDPAVPSVSVEVTPAATSINDPVADIELTTANGVIYCSAKNFVIYNTVGIDVTAQNGNLKGIYIVKYNGKAKTVLVK